MVAKTNPKQKIASWRNLAVAPQNKFGGKPPNVFHSGGGKSFFFTISPRCRPNLYLLITYCPGPGNFILCNFSERQASPCTVERHSRDLSNDTTFTSTVFVEKIEFEICYRRGRYTLEYDKYGSKYMSVYMSGSCSRARDVCTASLLYVLTCLIFFFSNCTVVDW